MSTRFEKGLALRACPKHDNLHPDEKCICYDPDNRREGVAPNPDLASYAESHPNAGKPEVSPRARGVALLEVNLWLKGPGTDMGYHTQSALDAAVVEEREGGHAKMHQDLQANREQVARLTKELAAAKNGREQLQAVLAIRDKQLAEAHGVLDADPSKIIRNAKDGYPEGRVPRVLTLAERVTAICRYAADYNQWNSEAEAKLSTERAAREVDAQGWTNVLNAALACDRAELGRITALVNKVPDVITTFLESIRQKLERTERELMDFRREHGPYDDELEICEAEITKYSHEGDLFGVNFWQGKHSGIVHGNIIAVKDLAALRAQLASVTSERDEAKEAFAVLEKNHMSGQLLDIVKDRIAAEAALGEGEYEAADGMEDVVRWMKQDRESYRSERDELQRKLAAAEERCAEAVRVRDLQKGRIYRMERELAELNHPEDDAEECDLCKQISAERDTLAQRVVELEGFRNECERQLQVKINDHLEALNESDTLKARCEKLEKALEKIARLSAYPVSTIEALRAEQLAREALNQSPE